MAISINTVAPVLAAQEAGGIAPELVLQPGSVVNAQVLKILVRRSGADCDRQPLDRCRLGNSAAAGPDPAARGHRRPRTASAWPWSGRAATPRSRGRRRYAFARCAGRCRSQPSDHRRTEECVDPGWSARRCRSRRRPRPPSRKAWRRCLPISAPPFPPAICRRNCRRRLRRCWRSRPASTKTSTAATSRRRSRSQAFSSRRRWHRVRCLHSGVPDLKAALIVLRQTLQSALGANAAPGATAAPVDPQRNRSQPCAVRRSSTSRKSCCRRRGCLPPQDIALPRQRRPQRAFGSAECRTVGWRNA